LAKPLAVGYVRQSMKRDDDLSPALQRDGIRELCKKKGWVLKTIEEDINRSGYSVSYKKRPGLMRLLNLVRTETIDRFVVYRQDRLSRNLKDALEIVGILDKHNVVFVTADGMIDFSEEGTEVKFSMFGMMAQEYSRQLKTMVRSACRQQAKRGIVPGGPKPYGILRQNGKIEKDPVTFATVEMMFNMAASGMPLVEIARRLESLNIDTPRQGQHWYADTIRRILQNPFYKGLFRYGGQVWEGAYEPLIPPDLWAKAQRIFSTGNRTCKHHTHLLSGLIKCGTCGRRFHVHYGGGRNRKRRYVCHSYAVTEVDSCGAPRLDAASTDDAVESLIKRLLRNPATIEQVEKLAIEEAENPSDPLLSELANVEKQLASIKKGLKMMYEDRYKRHMLPDDEFAKLHAEYKTDERRLETRKTNLLASLKHHDPEAFIDELKTMVSSLPSVWSEMETHKRNEALRSLGLSITVHDDRVTASFLNLVVTP